MASQNLTRGAPSPVDEPCPRHSSLDALLVRVGGSDRAAFAEFYDEMSQTVYALSLTAGHGPSHSAQLTLDAFLRVWQRSATFDPAAESAWGWVRSIVLNEIVTQSEKRRFGWV